MSLIRTVLLSAALILAPSSVFGPLFGQSTFGESAPTAVTCGGPFVAQEGRRQLMQLRIDLLKYFPRQRHLSALHEL